MNQLTPHDVALRKALAELADQAPAAPEFDRIAERELPGEPLGRPARVGWLAAAAVALLLGAGFVALDRGEPVGELVTADGSLTETPELAGEQATPGLSTPTPIWAAAAAELEVLVDPLPSVLRLVQPTLAPEGFARCSGEKQEKVEPDRGGGIVVEYCGPGGALIRALSDALWSRDADEPFAQIGGSQVTRRVEGDRQVLLFGGGDTGLDAPAEMDPDLIMAMMASMPEFDPRRSDPATGLDVDLSWATADVERVRALLVASLDLVAGEDDAQVEYAPSGENTFRVQGQDEVTASYPESIGATLEVGTETFVSIAPRLPTLMTLIGEFALIENRRGIDFFTIARPGMHRFSPDRSQVVFACGGVEVSIRVEGPPGPDTALVLAEQLAVGFGCAEPA